VKQAIVLLKDPELGREEEVVEDTLRRRLEKII